MDDLVLWYGCDPPGLLPDDERRREKATTLLEQDGMTSEEHDRRYWKEHYSSRVQAAIEEYDRSFAALSEEMRERGADLTPAAIEARYRAMACRWNEAVKGTATVARRCEECGRLAALRHLSSRHCSEPCHKKAENRRRNLRRKRVAP